MSDNDNIKRSLSDLLAKVTAGFSEAKKQHKKASGYFKKVLTNSAKIEELGRKVSRNEDFLAQKKVIFRNVPMHEAATNGYENPERTLDVLQKTVFSKMGISPSVDFAHRMKSFKEDTLPTIHCTFNSVFDKRRVFQNVKSLKGTRIMCSEFYTEETWRRMKPYDKKAYELRQKGFKTRVNVRKGRPILTCNKGDENGDGWVEVKIVEKGEDKSMKKRKRDDDDDDDDDDSSGSDGNASDSSELSQSLDHLALNREAGASSTGRSNITERNAKKKKKGEKLVKNRTESDSSFL